MPAAQRQTEHASRQSKLRAQGSEDYRLPETVRHPQPHYREMKKRYLERDDDIMRINWNIFDDIIYRGRYHLFHYFEKFIFINYLIFKNDSHISNLIVE